MAFFGQLNANVAGDPVVLRLTGIDFNRLLDAIERRFNASEIEVAQSLVRIVKSAFVVLLISRPKQVDSIRVLLCIFFGGRIRCLVD